MKNKKIGLEITDFQDNNIAYLEINEEDKDEIFDAEFLEINNKIYRFKFKQNIGADYYASLRGELRKWQIFVEEIKVIKLKEGLNE